MASEARCEADEGWLVYGTDCSYFTGKLEACLRARGIAYRLVPFGEASMRRCAAHTGVVQVPQVELPDGSWLVDTTLILEWLEETHAGPTMKPRSPAAVFLSSLLEDFADEWLWRPAMHYRWSFPANAQLMGYWLAEHLAERRVPGWLKRRYWRTRQLGTFVRGDGVNAANRAVVEALYLDTLSALESVFAVRPFLFGERPCAADFGFFGPMFRHFACDPVPGRILRQRAPAVHEWVARLWNLHPVRVAAAAELSDVPDGLDPILKIVADQYLPYLRANSEAYFRGSSRVQYWCAGGSFDEPVKPYRVWCRDRLHQGWQALDMDARGEVEARLGADAVNILSAAPLGSVSPPFDGLPLRGTRSGKPVDSWWR